MISGMAMIRAALLNSEVILMGNYEVLMLRKACEELALQVVILSSRLDDAEVRIEQLRAALYSAPSDPGELSDIPTP